MRSCKLNNSVIPTQAGMTAFLETAMGLSQMQPRFLTMILVGLLVLSSVGAQAKELRVTAGQDLQAIIQQADPGDTVRVAAGHYAVHLVIDKTLHLQGETGAILDGAGKGDVIRVRAADVHIRGFIIRNSGHNLTDMNASIFVERSAARVRITANRIETNGFGIWLDACPSPYIANNKLQGNAQQRSQDRGNGIHLYAVTDGVILNNEVWEARDGIYIDTSQRNRLEGNELHHLRYGIHYMYSYHNEVIDNLTHHTRTGYALMQSKYLTVTGNRSEQDGNYGILMNFITHSTIAGNRVWDVQEGRGYMTGGAAVAGAEGKALFVYNSQFNTITGNHFAGSDIGIHITAGSEDNALHGNAFVGNRVQVKYVANRPQEWSADGRGNYWSDYLGWDLNADGLGDKGFEPNDAVDKLLWKYPMARILMSSPAVETLRWVQEQFPVLRPQGVRDSHPLMSEAIWEQGP